MGMRIQSPRRHCLKFTCAILVGMTLTASSEFSMPAGGQQPAVQPPPVFLGSQKCAVCHYAQYKTWQTSGHGQAFEILPEKYKKDVECLQCHAAGIAPDAVPDSDPVGVGCEACHGAGRDHVQLALTLVDQGIDEEGVKRLHSLIQRNSIDQCTKCHVTKAHQPHPPFNRTVR